MPYSFSTGEIIRIEEVSYTDHPKYHLVLSVDDDLFFIINSTISNTIAFRQDWLDCQVEIKLPEHEQIEVKDKCYVACHEIADEIFSGDIETKLKKNEALNIGKLNNESLKEIVNVLEKSPPRTITTADRTIILTKLKAIIQN